MMNIMNMMNTMNIMGINEKTALGEILVEDGVISRSQLRTAMKLRETARKTGEELVKLSIISASEFEMALELQIAEILVGLGYVDEKQMFGTLRTKMLFDQSYYITNDFNDDDFSDF